MKCLTILNPYPAFILLPASDPRHKRVENRQRPFSYRGPLLIHAGKSDRMMEVDKAYRGLTFEWGKIVGVCELVDCVELEWADMLEMYYVPFAMKVAYPWLAMHLHTHGPQCLILENIRRFPEPVPCRGAQGLFNVTGLVEQRVRAQLEKAIAV
jgi:hypothetical protein